MSEIEPVPGQVWQYAEASSPFETVVAVRKEPRAGFMTATEVEVRSSAGPRWTRLPEELAVMKLVHQPADPEMYTIEAIWTFDGVTRVTRCSIRKGHHTEDDISKILVMRYTGEQRYAGSVDLVRTLRRIEA